MSKRITYKNPDEFTLEELGTLTSATMYKIIRQISPERKKELLAKCEAMVHLAIEKGTAPGQIWADSRAITRFPSPYAIYKKYAYLYTCIAGYQTDEDIQAHREEQFQETGITDEQVKAMEAKGWIVKRREVKK